MYAISLSFSVLKCKYSLFLYLVKMNHDFVAMLSMSLILSTLSYAVMPTQHAKQSCGIYILLIASIEANESPDSNCRDWNVGTVFEKRLAGDCCMLTS